MNEDQTSWRVQMPSLVKDLSSAVSRWRASDTALGISFYFSSTKEYDRSPFQLPAAQPDYLDIYGTHMVPTIEISERSVVFSPPILPMLLQPRCTKNK